jgi:hypothetical protein
MVLFIGYRIEIESLPRSYANYHTNPKAEKETKKILSRRNQFLIADHEKYRGEKKSLQAVKYNRYKRDNSHIILCLKSDLIVLDTSLSILLLKKKKEKETPPTALNNN